VSKQSEGKRGIDLISGVLLFVNFLGEFPRSSTYLFECVLLGAVMGYIVRLLEERLAALDAAAAPNCTTSAVERAEVHRR
jgi:hypothetical protein